MALVSCRECGQKISDQARTCPQCGIESSALNNEDVPAVKRFKLGSVSIFVLILLLLFIVAMIVKANGGDASFVGFLALIIIAITIYFLPAIVADEKST